VTIDCSGTGAPPVASALVVSPVSYDFTIIPGTCVNQTANFVVTGGVAPYTVFFASARPGASITPSTVAASGQGFSVTGLTDGVQITNVTVSDSGAPPLQKVVTIACPVVPLPPPVTVSPGTYTYLGGAACSSSASTFTITGGTAPFTVFFSTPGTAGTITPTLVTSNVGPNNTFTVTGLAAAPIPRVTQLTIQDSSPIPQFRTVNVDCRP